MARSSWRTTVSAVHRQRPPAAFATYGRKFVLSVPRSGHFHCVEASANGVPGAIGCAGSPAPPVDELAATTDEPPLRPPRLRPEASVCTPTRTRRFRQRGNGRS